MPKIHTKLGQPVRYETQASHHCHLVDVVLYCLKYTLFLITKEAGWRNWTAHLTTDQEVPGSSPGSVVILFFFLVQVGTGCLLIRENSFSSSYRNAQH